MFNVLTALTVYDGNDWRYTCASLHFLVDTTVLLIITAATDQCFSMLTGIVFITSIIIVAMLHTDC